MRRFTVGMVLRPISERVLHRLVGLGDVRFGLRLEPSLEPSRVRGNGVARCEIDLAGRDRDLSSRVHSDAKADAGSVEIADQRRQHERAHAPLGRVVGGSAHVSPLKIAGEALRPGERAVDGGVTYAAAQEQAAAERVDAPVNVIVLVRQRGVAVVAELHLRNQPDVHARAQEARDLERAAEAHDARNAHAHDRADLELILVLAPTFILVMADVLAHTGGLKQAVRSACAPASSLRRAPKRVTALARSTAGALGGGVGASRAASWQAAVDEARARAVRVGGRRGCRRQRSAVRELPSAGGGGEGGRSRRRWRSGRRGLRRHGRTVASGRAAERKSRSDRERQRTRHDGALDLGIALEANTNAPPSAPRSTAVRSLRRPGSRPAP